MSGRSTTGPEKSMTYDIAAIDTVVNPITPEIMLPVQLQVSQSLIYTAERKRSSPRM